MKFRSLSTLMLTGLMAADAFALPTPKAPSVALIKSKIDMKGIGAILGDHDPEFRDTIYVMPGDMKVTGLFSQTEATIDCRDLHAQSKKIYAVPSDAQAQKLISSKSFFNSLFELTTAIPADNKDVYDRIKAAKLESLSIHEKHKDEYSVFLKAEQEKLNATESLQLERDRRDDLRNDFAARITSVPEADKAEFIRNYNTNLDKIQARIDQQMDRLTLAQEKYQEAVGSWGPYARRLEDIDRHLKSITGDLDQLNKKFADFHKDEVDLLATTQSKVIGLATVGYSLNSMTGMNLLEDRLREQGLAYNVQPLRIFNVRLSPKIDLSVRSENSIAGEQTVEGAESETPTPIVTDADGETETETVTVGEIVKEDGKPVPLSFDMPAFKPSTHASDSFEVPVKLGAFCGTVEHETKITRVRTTDGVVATTKVEVPVMKARNHSVFAHTAPLVFNYYEKAERMKGTCSLDINQTSRYVRDHGKQSRRSGIFGKKKTKSWDHTRSDLKKNMDLSCQITQTPVGRNPEESRMMNDALEQVLSHDLFQMFLISYAKKWEPVEVKPTDLGPESQFFSQIGSGVMNLCGKNKYCEFAGVVLKSMDELVGSRHTGSSSHTATSTGKLSRNFDKDGYLVQEGSAKVDMKVCPNNKCEEVP